LTKKKHKVSEDKTEMKKKKKLNTEGVKIFQNSRTSEDFHETSSILNTQKGWEPLYKLQSPRRCGSWDLCISE
jgi:hypothetical protein